MTNIFLKSQFYNAVMLFTEDWCSPPWEKLDDNICLLLNSNIKPWTQSKFLCNFHGGELLYIENPSEHKTIIGY